MSNSSSTSSTLHMLLSGVREVTMRMRNHSGEQERSGKNTSWRRSTSSYRGLIYHNDQRIDTVNELCARVITSKEKEQNVLLSPVALRREKR